MKVLTLMRTEFARLVSSRMTILALVALMLVPVIYGALYLWGNQDPYGNLSQVPAALVVADQGGEVDGEQRNLGRETADELLQDGSFQWHEMSESEARQGVLDGGYDFAVIFPAAFTGDLASATTNTPTTAQLQLVTNDSNSYLSTTLAKQAAQTVRNDLAAEVSASASQGMLDSIASLRDGLSDATDGASQLADGTAQVADGASQLADGASDLANGASSLASGLSTLAQGSSALPSSTKQLDSGAHALASGLSSAASAGGSLSTAAQQAASLSPAVRAAVAQQLADAGVSDADAAAILGQLDQLTALTGGVSGGLSTLSPSLSQLSGGASSLASGTHTLAQQAPSLASGIATAAAGAGRLKSGSATLSSSSAQLADGATQADDGASALHDQLAQGLGQVPASTPDQRAAAAAAIADPVEVQQTSLASAQNYGAGLAPFFISLSAWIGVYALFLIVRPLSRRSLTVGRAPVRTAFAGWALPALLGVLQMAALFLTLTLGLGLQPQNPVGLLGFMVLASAAFVAIVQALNVWLGSVGQFLGLILMIVQLVTAGGTFPWQTLPAPLAALHQALPMAHAVDGARVLIYGGSSSDLLGAILVLAAWLVGALAVSALGAVKQSRGRTLRELRPSPIGG